MEGWRTGRCSTVMEDCNMDKTNINKDLICYIISNILGEGTELSNTCIENVTTYIDEHIAIDNPTSINVYVARIARERALELYCKNMDSISGSQEISLILDELKEIDVDTTEGISNIINSFLDSISALNRKVFVKRYFYMCSTKDIANDCQITESTVRTSLIRSRGELTAYISSEVAAYE